MLITKAWCVLLSLHCRLRVPDVPRWDKTRSAAESSHVRRHAASFVCLRLSACSVHVAASTSDPQDLHPRQAVRRLLRARRPQVRTNNNSFPFFVIWSVGCRLKNCLPLL